MDESCRRGIVFSSEVDDECSCIADAFTVVFARKNGCGVAPGLAPATFLLIGLRLRGDLK